MGMVAGGHGTRICRRLALAAALLFTLTPGICAGDGAGCGTGPVKVESVKAVEIMEKDTNMNTVCAETTNTDFEQVSPAKQRAATDMMAEAGTPTPLKLTVDKSFVLDAASPVGRIVVGEDAVARVRALTPESILIKGVRPGRTNLILWYKDGGIRVYEVTVEIDVSLIRRMVDSLFPDIAIQLQAVPTASPETGGGLLVTGDIPDAETQDRLMSVLKGFVPRAAIWNSLRVSGPRQVQIDVRIAEVSRSNLKRMGLRWMYRRSYRRGDLLAGQGDLTGSNTGIRNGNTDSGGEEYAGDSGVIRSFSDAVAGSVAGKGLALVLGCLDGDLLTMLDLLETRNLARILARPSLTAFSGRKAEFMVGGEFPVPVMDDGSVSVDYKEYGVKLAFSPVVIRRKTVYLDVLTRVSDIDYTTTVGAAGTTVPGVSTREARTSLELRDGQSFAIAGLLKDNLASVVDKIPLLGDLPILGSLFRSKQFRKNETELVIVVTPHLVHPLEAGEMPPLPGDRLRWNQSDLEFIFMNQYGANSYDWNPSGGKRSGMSRHGIGGSASPSEGENADEEQTRFHGPIGLEP